MRASTGKAGFTLIETMVAVSIFSLICLMVYSCWTTMVRATESSTVAAESAQRERIAIQVIEQALDGISWYESHQEAPLELDAGGRFSRLKVTSRVPPDFWSASSLAKHPVRRIEFVTEPTGSGSARLVMVQSPLMGETDSAHALRTVLLPEVGEFIIEVQPPHSTPSDQWSPVWGLTNGASGGLPARARVSLGTVEEFPRRQTMPVLASMAKHPEGPPGIGSVTNLAGAAFGEQGFDSPEKDPDARLVFLIDKSGSMYGGQLEMAKNALVKSLEAMEGKGKFYVYFFNSFSDAMRLSGTRSPVMLDANAANIGKVGAWIDSRLARGGTNPSDSLKSAFTHKPTELFLLTDGEFRTRKGDPKIGTLLQSLNSSKETRINTLAVGDPLRGTPAEAALMIIAKENGGTYTFIDPLTPSLETPSPVTSSP